MADPGPMRPTLRVLLALGAALFASAARPAAAASPDATLLHLSTTGTVQAVPDLLVAEMTGEIRAANVADAQKQLDRRMASAAQLAAAWAGAAKSASWRLEGYAVERLADPVQGKPQGWSARQTLRLEAPDPDALLDLVGRLQNLSLALGDLSWVLSPSRRAEAEAAASDLALKTLRRRADAAAAALGLKVGPIREVSLGTADMAAPLRPMTRMMAVQATPQATAATLDVSQSATAEIALHP